tara:strand:+ start:510 stop:740 length:231 start_codon:yes stop_codon:yes gene_type:complete
LDFFWPFSKRCQKLSKLSTYIFQRKINKFLVSFFPSTSRGFFLRVFGTRNVPKNSQNFGIFEKYGQIIAPDFSVSI